MSIVLPDRLAKIMDPANLSITGIDFIFVDPVTQQFLDIHFLRPPSSIAPVLSTTLTSPNDITVYCPAEDNAVMPVKALLWTSPDVVRIMVDHPGDFALYRLQIHNAQLDPYFNNVVFDFKAGCPSRLDCRPQKDDCPAEDPPDFPVDYLARDFWSFRTALLEFASLRYPAWPDRLEADAGIMLTEFMSAAGDEMAYHQDRISRESYLETATQRRSIRRHARLVDYEIHDGLGASAWMKIMVSPGFAGSIHSGTNVWASGDSEQRIDFEIGKGLAEEFSAPPILYPVDERLNALNPHIWDQEDICLKAGATEMWLEKDLTSFLVFDDFPNDGSLSGKWVCIETYPTDPAQTARAQVVRLIRIEKETDPVLGTDVTHIVWSNDQYLLFEYDLTILKVHANILPATAGKTFTSYFMADGKFSDLPPARQAGFLIFAGLPTTTTIPNTVEREGRDGTTSFRFTLPGTDEQNVVWLGKDPFDSKPEILLRRINFDTVTSVWSVDNINGWTWQRSLVGEFSSQPGDRHYTFDDGNWKRTVGYLDESEIKIHRDYSEAPGLSILFGDGEFGQQPAALSIFRADYRLGGGSISNVAAEAIRHVGYIPPPIPGPQSLVDTVSNPLAAINGLDPQSPDEIRQLAPEAFQNIKYRAVIPQDYSDAAELLPWVQKAGTAFRWTGSWISAFVTADPLHQVNMTVSEATDLLNQENRYRQAGREVIIQQPVYAWLDMKIEICARQDAYAGEVEKRVMDALFGKKRYPPTAGYFSPDRFTFGTVLERSTLEAAIQEVPGVLAVESICYRRRGWFDWKLFSELSYDPGMNSIIDIANDRLHPEEGILTIHIHGGL